MSVDAGTGRDSDVLARHCSDGAGAIVHALEDEAGNLGGYTVAGPVMDGPITYLDSRGEVIGSFHIFREPQTSEKVPGTIAQLNAHFPRPRRIGC